MCRLYAKEREAHHFASDKRIVKENPAVCLLESIGGGRLSSGRLIKRACGLCTGLTGAPMEVKFNGFKVFLILTIPMSIALENEVEDWPSLEEIYAEGFK